MARFNQICSINWYQSAFFNLHVNNNVYSNRIWELLDGWCSKSKSRWFHFIIHYCYLLRNNNCFYLWIWWYLPHKRKSCRNWLHDILAVRWYAVLFNDNLKVSIFYDKWWNISRRVCELHGRDGRKSYCQSWKTAPHLKENSWVCYKWMENVYPQIFLT